MNEYTLVPVTGENGEYQTVLTNLTKMYCCEWSQYTKMDVDELGRYAFEKYLPGYWQSPEKKAFLLRVKTDAREEKWAGFVLTDKDFILHKDYDYAMAEFFVLHKYRRSGAGRYMAKEVFERFPGRWELGRNPNNRTAAFFWDSIVDEYTGGNFEIVRSCPDYVYIDGTLGDVLSFSTEKTDQKEE